ncbi:MAG TPA: NAD-dependent epimerase/dehydratase family protein, partial [Candidatus Acidoferrum sp.]|nr:NAD-dependent epimerase/dehydratase family protein [Candidatus Acidoferrum sp.]
MPGENLPHNILVTGGAGYIGSVLVGRLLSEGYRVRVLDNLSYGGGSLLAYLPHERFELLVGDTRKANDVERALDGIDGVVHLAAIVGDPACAWNPKLARDVNQAGSELLADVAVRRSVRRFVFASTCSNYGKMAEPEGFVDENSPLNPVSLYAELKVGFEKHLLAIRKDGFTPICLRFATAFGLSPRPRFDLTVNEFTRDMALKKRLEVFGEQFWRPYCHTTDLARACITVLAADEEKVDHEVFNVGDTNQNYQKKTLVKIIAEQLPEGTGEVVFVHKDEDPRDYRVNFAKIQDRLGHHISRRVRDGVREIIDA